MSASRPDVGGLLATLADAVRTRLWPVPVGFVVLALALGTFLPLVDEAVADDLPSVVDTAVFGGGAAAARDVLAAVAGAFITVTSLTFSLTLVTLQLASSQYSPRLLRTFAGDRSVQVTLGLFLAIFVYSLVVLRSVREPLDDGGGFVPRLSVSLSVLLAVVGVVALVLFLAHLVRRIRIEPVLVDVREEAHDSLGRTEESEEVPAALQGRTDGLLVRAGSTGFVTSLDRDALVELARERDAVLDLTATPGRLLVRGEPLGRLLPGVPAGAQVREADEELSRAVREAVTVGEERTSAEDPTYGLRQLVDVAVRAVSPSLNDPTTAVHALAHLADVTAAALEHGLGDALLRDEDDVVRVVLRRQGVPEVLDVAVGQPLLYASGDPVVLAAMLRVLTCCARVVGSDAGSMDLVRASRDRVSAAAEGFREDERWRLLLDEAVAAVDEAAAGRP
ncbi:DUF2254 domain-containing protein [Pseudokineococcus sp. 1T1Z-3]|uniref:DUF2254 domain-containing protein n=1 Tax=Pseudokineococcus sp. 1T1Z-3 TaxID=3132745 RepID=UPI0030B5D3D1